MTPSRAQRRLSTALAVLATLTVGAGVAQVARLRPPLPVKLTLSRHDARPTAEATPAE